MNGEQPAPAAYGSSRLWFGWRFILLAGTVASAYVPMGIFNTIVNLAIAALKVALIMLFFMKLRSSSPLLRLSALAGLFWLIFMFALTGSDYFTRQ